MALSDLRFNITANDTTGPAFAKTEANAREAQVAVAGLSKSMISGFAGGFAALATSEAIFELPKAIGEVIKQTAELAEQSKKLGIPVEQLQEMQYGAEKTGVSFDVLESALGKFNVEVGKANAGGGELFKTFQDNGVALGKTSYANLLKYADLIKNARTESDKLLLVQQGFGRGSSDLVNFFSGGAAAIEEFARQRDALGPIISDAEAEKAKVLNDRFVDLETTLSTYAKEGALSFASALQQTADNIDQTSSAIDRAVHNPSWDAFWTAMLGKRGDGLTGQIRSLIDPGTAETLSGQHGIGSDAVFPVVNAGRATATHTGGSSASGVSAENALNEAIAKTYDSLRQQTAALGETDRQKAIDEQLTRAHTSVLTADGQQITLWAGQLYDATEAQKALTASFDKFRGLARDALGTIYDDLKQGKSLWTAFADAAMSALDKIANNGLDKLITDLFGASGSSSGGSLGTSFLGSIAHLLGFAEGGTVIAGGAGGPDSQLFAARVTPGERIDFTPPGKSRSGGGDTTVHLHVDVTGARGNQEIQTMVAQGVSAGLSAYDKAKGRQMALAG